jgi:hypothetical protein
MAFPEKNFFGFPKGWKDLGEIKPIHILIDGKVILERELHTLCHTRLHVGKEGENLFIFCPRCLVVIDY